MTKPSYIDLKNRYGNKNCFLSAVKKQINAALILLGGALYAANSMAQDDSAYQISGEMVESGDVASYQISPDGEFVVYWADQNEDEVYELYSVPITGGAAVRLNPDLIAGGSVSDRGYFHFGYQISADSKRVVYRADQDEDEVYELYSVPITGGAVVRLNPDLVANWDVSGFRISADGKQVVYRADQDEDEVYELHSVSITGGKVVRLSLDLGVNGDLSVFQISADGKWVVYSVRKADLDLDGKRQYDLYSVPTAGGPAVRLSHDQATGKVDPVRVHMSADSKWVVYLVKRNGGGHNLYSVPIAGGLAVRLNQDRVWGVKISSDSGRVVYLARQYFDGRVGSGVYSVPIEGGKVVHLYPKAPEHGKINISHVRISPDGRWVVYRATTSVLNPGEQTGYAWMELYSVPILGGNVVQLTQGLVYDEVFYINITGDSKRVVFRENQDFNSYFELYSTRITGGKLTRLADGMPHKGKYYRLSVDGTRVVFLEDQDEDGKHNFDLYSAPTTGGNASRLTRLNFAIPIHNAGVHDFQISPNGEHVVYLADQDVVDELELFAIRLKKLNDELCVPIKAENGNVAVICL